MAAKIPIQITAVDSHPPFIEAIRARYPQVTAFAGDMATAEGPFDFIWCAGALYFLGLSSGLAAFRPRLAETGAIACALASCLLDLGLPQDALSFVATQDAARGSCRDRLDALRVRSPPEVELPWQLHAGG